MEFQCVSACSRVYQEDVSFVGSNKKLLVWFMGKRCLGVLDLDRMKNFTIADYTGKLRSRRVSCRQEDCGVQEVQPRLDSRGGRHV